MKRFLVTLFFAVLAVSRAVPGFCQYQALSEREVGVELAKRQPVAEKWISAAETVARKTGNEAATEIAKSFRKGSVIAAPFPRRDALASVPLQDYPEDRMMIGIVPLIPEDRKIKGPWKEIFDVSRSAMMLDNPEGNILVVVKDDLDISEIWRGLIIIHEGTHVLDVIQNGSMVESDDPDERLRRRTLSEFEAYSLEGELLKKLGGKEYQALLDEEGSRIWRDYNSRQDIPLPAYGKYAARLEKIFGKALSKTETGIRESVLWIHAVFELMDRKYKPEESWQRKLDFLYSSIKQGFLA